MAKKRVVSMDAMLTEFRCVYCRTLVNPNGPHVMHPQLGMIHERCAHSVSWTHHIPARDPLKQVRDWEDEWGVPK